MTRAVRNYRRNQLTRAHPYAALAGRAAGALLRGYMNRSSRKTASRSRNAGSKSSTFPVSQYHENRTLYRRKRMPRGKKRRWVAFKKKVQSVSWGSNKKNVVYHKDAYDCGWSADGVGVSDVMMNTGFNTANPAFYDMLRCLQVAQQSSTSAAQLGRILVKNARCFMTVTNASNTQVYMDVYWLYCRKDVSDLPADLMKVGMSTTAVLEAGGDTVLGTEETSTVGTNKALTSFGATPFMSTALTKHFKITKVTKHLLAPGTSVEFSMNYAKNFFVSQPTQEAATPNAIASLKGKTKGCLIVAYGPPNSVAGTTGQYGAAGQLYIRREVQYTFHPVDVGSKEYIVDN